MFPRLLPRQSGPTLGAVAVIGTGVGLAAMVLVLADPYLARGLPYAHADRLVSLEFGLGDPGAGYGASPSDAPSLASWQARTDLFEGLAAFDDPFWLRAELSDRVVPLRAVAVTANLLHVLGLEPQPAVDTDAAWISNRAATTLSGGELAPGRFVPVVPKGTLRVRSVLPVSFLFPQADVTEPIDALVALQPGPVIVITPAPARSSRALHLVALRRPDVTPEMIGAALRPSLHAIGRTLSVVPLHTAMTARQRALAGGASLASVLLILICLMNVFNIALTRGLYRQSELATRTALGATPAQLVRLVLVDGLRVAMLGAATAMAVTWMALGGAVGVLPAQFATVGDPAMTGRTVTFIVLAAVAAWLSWFLGSIVGWRGGTRHHIRHMLGRDRRAVRAVRFGVIAGQVCAATVLLTAAALLGRSYLNLLLVDAGMDGHTQAITVAHDSRLSPAVRSEVVDRVVAAMRRLERVQAAGVKSGDMVTGRFDGQVVFLDGQILAAITVDRGFLDAAGLRFVVGGPPPPGTSGAVITETIASEYFPGRSAVGSVFSFGRDVPVVGVVRDVRTRGLADAARPVIYEVGSAWPVSPQSIFTYVLRVDDASRPVADWHRVLRPIDPMAAVLRAETVGERLARSVRDRTFATVVVGLFATASVVVTALGLAGVVGYTVVKRTREVAVRLTLGATRPSVWWLVVREAVTAALCGTIAGATASVWLSAGLGSLLYGVSPADPVAFLVAAAGLLAVVGGAASLPAIRTGGVAPATALRTE